MKQVIYCVTSYRWADNENHSYVLGLFTKKHAAIKAAEQEEDHRGGKYGCEVLEIQLDTVLDKYKVIRAPVQAYPEMIKRSGT